MEHIMIDIETLGTKPGAVILSIAAVKFDLELSKVSPDIFTTTINIDDCIERGLKIEKAAIIWWLNQSKEAQETITNHVGEELMVGLAKLHDFIKPRSMNSINPFVWGNSARFDLGILEAAFNACNLKIPWEYYNERDVRTLVSFKPEIKENMPFSGVKHTPLADCIHQIKYCCETWKYLKNEKN